MRGLVCAILVMLSSTAQADTLGEEDGMTINRITSTEFEVIEGANFGAAEFWCGAATYVKRRSGLPGQTPIYVQRPWGPSITASQRKGVVFTLDPARASQGVKPGLSLSVKSPGLMMKASRARSYCRDAFTRSTK